MLIEFIIPIHSVKYQFAKFLTTYVLTYWPHSGFKIWAKLGITTTIFDYIKA